MYAVGVLMLFCVLLQKKLAKNLLEPNICVKSCFDVAFKDHYIGLSTCASAILSIFKHPTDCFNWACKCFILGSRSKLKPVLAMDFKAWSWLARAGRQAGGHPSTHSSSLSLIGQSQLMDWRLVFSLWNASSTWTRLFQTPTLQFQIILLI